MRRERLSTKLKRQNVKQAVVVERREEVRVSLSPKIVRQDAMIQGLSDACSSALGFIDAGHVDAARQVLSGARFAFITHLRDRVAREPGGVLHEKSGDG